MHTLACIQAHKSSSSPIYIYCGWPVASLGLVSLGVVTRGVTLMDLILDRHAVIAEFRSIIRCRFYVHWNEYTLSQKTFSVTFIVLMLLVGPTSILLCSLLLMHWQKKSYFINELSKIHWIAYRLIVTIADLILISCIAVARIHH